VKPILGRSIFMKRSILLIISFPLSTLIFYLFTQSFSIALPIGVIFTATPFLVLSSRERGKIRHIESLWPEVLDVLISGIQSGLSLSQTVVSLSSRGPIEVRPIFERFSSILSTGGSFEAGLSTMKEEFSNSISDQVIEVLRISQNSGSRDTSLILRTLAEYITADLALREEIRAQHSWIRNSAILAAITPWVLLILLTTQENARIAYQSNSGIAVLFTGVIFTAIAFLWMQKVGKLETSPRVFVK